MQVRAECILIWYLVASLLVLQSTALARDKDGSDDDLNSAINESLQREPEHTLRRQRRYLEFPEGSSFQFVYDLVVAVVNNVNYITVSITVALAWELPSKPPSELLEDVKDRLKDGIGQLPRRPSTEDSDPSKSGTLGTERNDSASHVTYTDPLTNLSPRNETPSAMHQSYRYPTQNYIGVVTNTRPDDWRRVSSNIYSSHKVSPFQQYTHTTSPLRYSHTAGKYPWWRLRDPVRPVVHRNALRHYEPVNPPDVMRHQRHHHIFPILGKRIANETHFRHRRNGISSDNPTKVDRIHIRHQRRTRHDLYEAIEKYLDRKKLSGHYCILRALCETSQKSEEREPGSFVGELMRAMFTLPEPFEDELQGNRLVHNEQRYDAAQALPADCSDHYHHCEHSLWSSSFVS